VEQCRIQDSVFRKWSCVCIVIDFCALSHCLIADEGAICVTDDSLIWLAVSPLPFNVFRFVGMLKQTSNQAHLKASKLFAVPVKPFFVQVVVSHLHPYRL